MYDPAISKNAMLAEVITGNEWCWGPTRSDPLVGIQGALCGSCAACVDRENKGDHWFSIDDRKLIRERKQRISWHGMV